jgi:hypothetical protein
MENSAISQNKSSRTAHRNRKRREKKKVIQAAKLAKFKSVHFFFQGQWMLKKDQPLLEMFARENNAERVKFHAIRRKNRAARLARLAAKAPGLGAAKGHFEQLAHRRFNDWKDAVSRIGNSRRKQGKRKGA